MKAGDIVRHRVSRVVGVILPPRNELETRPLSVIWDGSSTPGIVDNEKAFEVIGQYKAEADKKGCGAQGRMKHCRFLGFGAPGTVICLRFTDVHWDLESKASTACRDPQRLYPNCKLPSSL